MPSWILFPALGAILVVVMAPTVRRLIGLRHGRAHIAAVGHATHRERLLWVLGGFCVLDGVFGLADHHILGGVIVIALGVIELGVATLIHQTRPQPRPSTQRAV
jgi:hypothetical protein